MSRSTIARHVRILRKAGLVKERRAAQKRFYSLEANGLAEVDRWLAPHRLYWAARLSDLKTVVEERARAQKQNHQQGDAE